MKIEPFADRQSAGLALADALASRYFPDPVVLALPRGGVPVALPVAQRLGAPLDLLLVRKIGAPHHAELAAAAIVDGESPELVRNEEVIRGLAIPGAYLEFAVEAELKEIARRRAIYRGGRPAEPVEGRTAIVVDDGIATGTTVKAALQALRRRRPKALALAVPVAPADAVEMLKPLVDELICLAVPAPFLAVGAYYADFEQLSDEEVVALLAAADPRSG